MTERDIGRLEGRMDGVEEQMKALVHEVRSLREDVRGLGEWKARVDGGKTALVVVGGAVGAVVSVAFSFAKHLWEVLTG